MGYAEVELTDARGATSRVTFDSHGYRDLVSYRKRRLSRAEQRRLFGKTIAAAAPTARSGSGSDESVRSGIIWVVAALVILVIVIAAAQHADGVGSGGSGGGPGGVVRPVYGGGGGGVGK